MSWLLGIFGFFIVADGFDQPGWHGQAQAQVIFGGLMMLVGVVLYAFLGDD